MYLIHFCKLVFILETFINNVHTLYLNLLFCTIFDMEYSQKFQLCIAATVYIICVMYKLQSAWSLTLLKFH